MEALQILKFHLKKVRLNFTKSWIMKEAEMIQDDPEVDLLGVLVNNNSEGEGAYNITLDQLMKEINGEDLEGLGDLE